jgi:hypothetical protein
MSGKPSGTDHEPSAIGAKVMVHGNASVGKLTVIGAVHGDVVVAAGSERDRILSAIMQRRALLRNMTTGLGAVVSASLIDGLDLLRGDVEQVLDRGSTSSSSLDEWQRRVDDHIRAYALSPPISLLLDLAIDFADLSAAFDASRSPTVQSRLLHLLGQLAGTVSVLLNDLGALRPARDWMGTARLLARETGDLEMAAWCFAREAFFFLHYDRAPGMAIDLARAAAEVAGDRPFSATVMAPTVEARALAKLGATADGLAALRRADDAFERSGEAGATGLFGWTEPQLRFSAGKTLTTLGCTQLALEAQDVALALFPPEEILDPTLLRLDRAQALIRAGDVTEGCRLGSGVLAGLPAEYSSPLVTSWTNDAILMIPEHTVSPEAREFIDAATARR